MTDLFLKAVDMALSAGWMTLAVLIVRLVLKKGPKWVGPVLWGMVAVRLVLPFRVESVFSLLPGRQFSDSLQGVSQIPGEVPPVGGTVGLSPIVGEVGQSQAVVQPEPAGNWLTAAAVIWLVGAAVMLCCALFSYVRLVRRVRTAVLLEGNVWQSEFVHSPFVLGFFRPRIYLPFSVRKRDIPSIIAHERAHIARRDHCTKVLGFLLLSVYWFHPLLWAAWFFFCRDLESACDERVIREMNETQRVEYSTALLACGARQKRMGVCPIAFGELSVKERVGQVLHYQKPALWMAGVAILLCVVMAVCFLTDPVRAEEYEEGSDPGSASVNTGEEKTPRPTGTLSLTGETEKAPDAGQSIPAPTPTPVQAQPPVLTEETAKEFLTAVLLTLRVHEDGRVTFSLPALFPVAEGSECDLFINLNATYTESPGVSAVQKLLKGQKGWKGGDVFEGKLDSSLGEVRTVSLWVAFTLEEGNKTTQYATDFLELTAPFDKSEAAAGAPSVTVGERGNRAELSFVTADGTRGMAAFDLPAGLTTGEGIAAEGDIVGLTLCKGEQAVAALRLIPFATTDEETLRGLKTAENTLPMPVFATVAAANHAGYEDYTVRKSTDTGACATAKYVWQDLTEYGGRAAEAPWQSVPCVLAYDTAESARFVEIVFLDGTITEGELARLAQSITISG